MRIKFLAPPIALAFLFMGLSYVDAAPVIGITRAPECVELTDLISYTAAETCTVAQNDREPNDVVDAALDKRNAAP